MCFLALFISWLNTAVDAPPMHTWHHVIFEKAPKKHSTVSYVLLDGPHLATAAASSQFIIRLVLYVEGLATAAFTFGIGIVEGEFAGQFILLPIHDGSNNVEQGHRLDEDVDPVRRHRSVLRRLFKCVIQCVGQSVASSSFDAQPYSQCAFRIVAGEQFLYPFCCPVRQLDGILRFQNAPSSWLLLWNSGEGSAVDNTTIAACDSIQERPCMRCRSSVAGEEPPRHIRGDGR
mmetsp:Transcript_18518/g.51498  ORF Transcript_18518/g.51498 Transcript_18518/m.51498 type:complete len:232 (+) Transcript_18518:135-830(+)